MIEDLDKCVVWAKKNIQKYGGNPKDIFLKGHSAGAHIVAQYLVKRAKMLEGSLITENAFDSDVLIRGFIGLAGVYHIRDHYGHEAKRGVEKLSPMWKVMKGLEVSSFNLKILNCRTSRNILLLRYCRN